MRKTILSFLFLIFVFSAFAESKSFQSDDNKYIGSIDTSFDSGLPILMIGYAYKNEGKLIYNIYACFFETKESAEQYCKQNIDSINDYAKFYSYFSVMKDMEVWKNADSYTSEQNGITIKKKVINYEQLKNSL